MYKISVEFRGVKAWEVILAFKSVIKKDIDNYEILGDGWRAKIVKEGVDIRYGMSIPVTYIEAEGDRDKVERVIKELRLRLFKASGI